MRVERRVIALSVAVGVLVWVADAVLDYLVFYEGTFWGLLIAAVPPAELYSRSLAFAGILAFGIVVSIVSARRRRAEEALRERTGQLRERVKDLKCLYGISSITEKRGLSLREILQRAVELIPRSWQYPEVTCARITLEGQEFRTEGFKETAWRQASGILVHGEPAGTVEVYYLEERPEADAGPFLKEERSLLNSVAERLGHIAERRWTAERLQHLNRMLRGIRNVNQLLVAETDADGLLQGVCDSLVETQGYHDAWAALVDEAGGLAATAQAGLGEAFLPMVERLKRGELPNCAHRALAERDVVVVPDPASTCPDCPLVGSHAGGGAMAAPLTYGERVYGLMAVSVPARFATDEEAQTLLKEVAEDIGLALHSNELEDEGKQAAEALGTSEKRYGFLLESITDGVQVLDRKLRYLVVNDELARMAQMPKAKLLGSKMTDLFPGVEETVFLKTYEKVLETREPAVASDEFVFEDGRRGWFDVHAYPAAEGILVIVTDITERKRAEEEQRRLQQQMQETQRLERLGVLAGGIAHDFNNILMTVLGNAALALRDLSPVSPARERLREIEKGARHAADLCRQLLGYSGRGRFVIEPIDLSELVEEMAHMLDVSISKKAVLKYGLSEGLPAVEADATQMRQIVMNLVTNASDAIGERSGVISIATGAMQGDRDYLSGTYLAEDLPEGIYVYMEVSDTGCGMNDAIRDRLFEPYFTTKSTGRGLGLAAVLGIVRGHRGAIKVYSEEGKGTTFKALLPASEVPALARQEGAEPEEWTGSGTVLVVDDEETVRAVTGQMIERAGFDVIAVQGGQEALEVYRERGDEIACVVLDLTMPHMSGEECFRELRRINKDVRVVLTSGYTEQDVTERFAGKGLAGFIQKPYALDQMRDKLRECLSE